MTREGRDGYESGTHYAGPNLGYVVGVTLPLRIFPDGLQGAMPRVGYGVIAVSVLAASTLHSLYGFEGSTRTAAVHWSLRHVWVVIPVILVTASSQGFMVADTAVILGRIAASILISYHAVIRIDWVRRLFE